MDVKSIVHSTSQTIPYPNNILRIMHNFLQNLDVQFKNTLNYRIQHSFRSRVVSILDLGYSFVSSINADNDTLELRKSMPQLFN